MKSHPYTIVFDEIVREVGITSAAIAGKIISYCADCSECTISLQQLCADLELTHHTVKACLERLKASGYIDYVTSFGRGNFTTVKKCQKLLLFQLKKWQKFPLLDEKKVAKIATYKDNIIKDKGGDAHACARRTPKPSPKKKVMENLFNQFLTLFKPAKEHEHTREDAERQWYALSEETQRAIIAELKNGKRNNAERKPYWYLHNWRKPLPVFYNGDPALTDAIKEIERKHKENEQTDELVLLRYNNKNCYCYSHDLQMCLAAGAIKL